MDYLPLIFPKIKEFHEKFPDYSMGDIVYSVLRQLDNKMELKKKDIRNITDEEFYLAIHKAMREEKEEEIIKP